MSENFIDASGIHTQTFDQIRTAIIEGTTAVPGYKQIYGSDINTDSNTPDGQAINIYALSKQDILDLATMVYNSKDPDQAVGVALDAIAALCGIARKGGSYTLVAVDVVATQSVDLIGIDTDESGAFTIADSVGNQFKLLVGQTITAGTTSLNFRAVNIGNVQVLPSTIVVAVTILAGIASLDNPLAPYQQGVDQETDATFRVRRQQSTAMPAQGILQGLYGALLQLPGVTRCAVYENNTDASAGDVPARSIWVIVDGGVDTDIAEVIYRYRSLGCGMKGTEEIFITQPDGTEFPILFDFVVQQDLYINMHVDVVGGGSYDATYLKEQIALLYQFGIYQEADITTLQSVIKSINPQLAVSAAEVSGDDVTYVDTFVYPDSKQNKFVIDTANITIS